MASTWCSPWQSRSGCLLSIVNAFTLWYAGAEMQAIFDGYDATSQSFAMLQLLDIDHAISKALGVGGMLAASVPPLALFIVSGSAMVANSIMGQMTQGDKFRSEDVAPRAKEQAPVLATTGGSHPISLQWVLIEPGQPKLLSKYLLSKLPARWCRALKPTPLPQRKTIRRTLPLP